MDKNTFWNCNSPKLASFIMSKGIKPIKSGKYQDGCNYWAFLYIEIQPILDEYHNLNK